MKHIEYLAKIANDKYNGELTILKRGSTWKVALGIITPTDQTLAIEIINKMATGITVEEAIENAVIHDISIEGIIHSINMPSKEEILKSIQTCMPGIYSAMEIDEKIETLALLEKQGMSINKMEKYLSNAVNNDWKPSDLIADLKARKGFEAIHKESTNEKSKSVAPSYVDTSTASTKSITEKYV